MNSISDQALLASRARLPQHVVHRSFVAETVVLNLRTGKYHGLNPTAGRMLEALDAAADGAGRGPGAGDRVRGRGGADRNATFSPSAAACSSAA